MGAQKYSICITLLLLFNISACSNAKLDFEDPELYPRIESLLQQDVTDFSSNDIKVLLKNSGIYQQIMADATKQQLIRMTHNEDFMLTALAAYHVIASKYPKLSALAATNVLMRSKWIEKGTLRDLEEFLRKYKVKADLYICLDEIAAQSENCRRINLLILAEIFHENGSLTEWFESRADNSVKQPWLSVVLGQIVPMKGEQAITEKVRRALESTSQDAGYPRYVYVLLSDRSDDEYAEIVKLALNDKGIDDAEFAMMVRQKKDFIKRRFDGNDLNLSGERKEIFVRELGRK